MVIVRPIEGSAQLERRPQGDLTPNSSNLSTRGGVVVCRVRINGGFQLKDGLHCVFSGKTGLLRVAGDEGGGNKHAENHKTLFCHEIVRSGAGQVAL